jgi:uncharacterized protein YcfL
MKKLLKYCSWLVIIPALMLGFGCQTTSVDSVRNANSNAMPSPIVDQRVQTDKSLGKDLSVISVSESSASENLLKVQVIVRNNKNKAANYSYSFEWFDVDGIAVRSTNAGWKSVRLLGKEEKALVAIAANPKAVDFVFKIQEANPKTRLP